MKLNLLCLALFLGGGLFGSANSGFTALALGANFISTQLLTAVSAR
jgi:hypothetical protein